MRVMIVEDQTMIRSLLESYFRAEEGCRIIASIPGAKQAVEMCRINSVDLILMDVQTENRENGLTAVRQIKAIQPKSKIIVVTSLIECRSGRGKEVRSRQPVVQGLCAEAFDGCRPSDDGG